MTALFPKLLLLLLMATWGTSTFASSLDYFVLGVITSSEDRGAVALIKHKPSGKVGAHKIGDPVGAMKLLEVHLKYVLLKDKNQTYKVQVGSDDPMKYEAPNSESAPVKNLQIAEGLEKQGNELRVQSALKEKLLTEDLATILMQAAAEPFIKDGSILGFKLWDIEKDSIYEKAGFVNGDLITHINGTPLTGAGNAIKTLKSLRNTADVEITYVNQGTEKNLRIVVQ
jgi:type II secretory pathway component PulC